MTKIIIKKMTYRGVLRTLLFSMLIIPLVNMHSWIYEVLYEEKEIEVHLSEEEYLNIRDKYHSVKVSWKYVDGKRMKRPSYLFLQSSTLVHENREFVLLHDMNRKLPILVKEK